MSIDVRATHEARTGQVARRLETRRAAPWGIRVLAACAIAFVAIALLPGTAHAWTPGTHIFLGEAVLRSLSHLPDHIAELLSAYPHEFLYGSVAADTSIAKKYAPVGRHCHSWHVGLEIYEAARDEPLRAFGLGYLAITAMLSGLGHSYWESRFETHLGAGFSRRAREVVILDHSRADEHLDRILSPTIFSTRTNRRIFRGMVYVTDTESWQRIFQLAADNSRRDLASTDVTRYMERSYDYILDFLQRVDRSEPFALDPSGDEALRLAKRVRRDARRSGLAIHVAEQAGRRFAMPESSLRYAAALPEPLYSPASFDRS